MQYATAKQMQESLGAPGWKFTNVFLIKILYLHPRNGLWQGKKYFQQKKFRKSSIKICKFQI